jgi:Na+:H+ antiporter, NhaC family
MGKKVPLWQTLIVMIVMILLLVWSIVKDAGGEPHIALILAAAVAAIVAGLNGWKWSYLEQGILASINRSMQAILILCILGAILGSWMAAGTIPSMMYYGIKVISPKVFLLTACILCCIVSLATGSSWSTAGSMGVALMGVGAALGFPDPMIAGAVVSGAYFGDKMSPLSDTTNLAPAMAGATLFGHIKHMIYTTGTSLIIALVVYAIMGFMHASANEPDMSVMQEILDFIAGSSNISVITLIPPLFVICAVALKLPAIPALLGGAVIAVPFMFMNSAAVEEAVGGPVLYNIFNIMNNGISLGVVPDDASVMITKLGDLLSSGSVQGMMWTNSIILFAMCFGGILDCTGMMASVADLFLKVAKGRGGLVLSTELMCILTNAVCCDQYLSLVLPGRMFKEKFEDMRLRPENLSRCLEDSGTITSNFFGWNTCGATMRNFLGVDSSYIPYAILNWVNPIVSVFFGYTGITMTKLTEEEYQRILDEREEEKRLALKSLEA